MTDDILAPKGNESELVAASIRRGCKAQMLVYHAVNQIPKELPSSARPILWAREVQKVRSGDIALISPLSRASSESKKVRFVTHAEVSDRKDGLHARRSELNQVLAKLIKQKIYCFDWNLLLYSKEPHVILGRMMQNARVLRKYKVPMAIISMATIPEEAKSPKDFEAFATMLGIQHVAKLM